MTKMKLDPIQTERNPLSEQTYLIQVDNRLPEVVALLVEVSHTDLSKVTGMVLVHVGSVVMLSTSETATTWMLAVLAYTTVTGRDVSAVLAGLAQMGRHLDVVVVEMFVGCCRDLFNKCSKAKLKLGCCGCAKPGWMIVCWQGRWVSEMGLGRSEALIFDLRWMKQRWDSRMTFWEMVKRGWG